MANDEFSNAPKSLSEVRADRSGLARDMTPRDTVIMFLRDLDSGKLGDVRFLSICFAKDGEDGIRVNEYCGGKHEALEMIGLLEECKYRLMGDVAGK